MYQTDLATGLDAKNYNELLSNITSTTGIEPIHIHKNVYCLS